MTTAVKLSESRILPREEDGQLSVLLFGFTGTRARLALGLHTII